MNNPLRTIKRAGAKGVLRAPVLPFLLLWAFMAVCHLLFVMGTRDDVYHATILREHNLLAFTAENYLSWSSRSLVDIPNFVFNYLPHLAWQVANPLVIVGLAWAMAGLVGIRRNAGACWALCGLLVLYPWQVLDSAGWVTTTTVFLWPAAAATGALRILQRRLGGQPTPLWMQCLAVAGVLYAANHEQVLVILLPLLALLCAASLLQRRRVPGVLWGALGAAATNLLYIALCPGNQLRLENETVSRTPDLGMKGLLSKLELGASAALEEVFYSHNTIFFFFLVLLAWAVFQRRREWYFRAMALVPLLVCGLFGMYGTTVQGIWPGAAFFRESVTGNGIITLANVSSPAAFLPLLVLYGSLILVLVCVYLAFGHTATALGVLASFGLGFASRVALGFSPTIWTSGPRTSLFWQLATIAVAALLYRTVQPGAQRWQKLAFWCVFGAYCLVGLYAIQEMRIASGY